MPLKAPYFMKVTCTSCVKSPYTLNPKAQR